MEQPRKESVEYVFRKVGNTGIFMHPFHDTFGFINKVNRKKIKSLYVELQLFIRAFVLARILWEVTKSISSPQSLGEICLTSQAQSQKTRWNSCTCILLSQQNYRGISPQGNVTWSLLLTSTKHFEKLPSEQYFLLQRFIYLFIFCFCQVTPKGPAP